MDCLKKRGREEKCIKNCNSSEGISGAFRKLLHRISAKINIKSEPKAPRVSFSTFHNQLLLKRKKTSASLFQKKNHHFYSSNTPKLHHQTQQTHPTPLPQSTHHKGELQMVESPFRSVRCHSNPSSLNDTKLQNRTNGQNKFLTAKTYNFQDALSKKDPKRDQKQIYIISNPLICQKQISVYRRYEKSLKHQQKRRSVYHSAKMRAKTDHIFSKQQFEPWESDKIQQFGSLHNS